MPLLTWALMKAALCLLSAAALADGAALSRRGAGAVPGAGPESVAADLAAPGPGGPGAPPARH